MKGNGRLYLFFLFLLPAWGASLKAQSGFELDIKKPEPYTNRELKSEKTGSKKLKLHRRILQNTATHYNYFYNAQTKLNEVVDKAKAAHREDYATLLPFYNYTTEATAQDKSELDSVIYKSKTGIVLHDLRNDWIDDLYLLWGTAYYLQQEYDSAFQLFQFINYAFAEKEKDGYYKYIGSRTEGSQATTISTPENNRFPRGMIADPPSRNAAFIWQIRTLIQSNAMAEAGSLMATLKNDPLFPERLRGALEEVQAWWYYRQERWDSSALHLTRALDQAGTRQEKARWEYLAAQMFEKAGLTEQAETWYRHAIDHTIDPVLDIYARLSLIRINKASGDDLIAQNIAELVKMARRDRYENYRDVIYYMAAHMELERKNYVGAQFFFLKAAQYKNGNLATPGQSFLQAADLSFSQKNYTQAAALYDSVRTDNLPADVTERIAQRKAILARLLLPLGVVHRQDSLQRIAGLPEDERSDYIRKLVRQLRRQQGLKEEGTATNPATALAANANAPTDLFRTAAKGEWYFYNANSKSQGAAAFKQAWGNRPNADNWRRSANVVAQMRNNLPNNTRGVPETALPDPTRMLTYEGLLENLPLTEGALQLSNDSIADALFTLGRIYTDDMEDLEAAIEVYESLRRRFPQNPNREEVLFRLHYAYTQTGNAAKAAEMKNGLASQFPGSRYTTIVTTGHDPSVQQATAPATQAYEAIYDLFIEGRFAEAKRAKQKADSLYRTTYWSPQLLYIEAVYHIRQREDSIATAILNTLIQQNNGSPLAEKATNLRDVLARRKQIEQELATMQVERPVETPPVVVRAPQKQAPTKQTPSVQAPPARDTTVQEPPPTINVTRTQQVKTDTAAARPRPSGSVPPATAARPPVDTPARKPVQAPTTAATFTYIPESPHFAVVLLNAVDAVFGNETRNAFNRYNQERYYSRSFQSEVVPLDNNMKLLVIGPFINVQDVVTYMQKTKPLAANEIIPWLKKDKYAFTIISEANLQVLKENRNLEGYLKFLDQHLPVKF